MTDTEKLNKAISSSGLKIQSIAKKMGLSYYGLYKKVNNTNEFKASEVITLSELLGLTIEERERIFFANKSD